MSVLAFPIAALAVTFLLLIPGLTVLSALALRSMRARATSWATFGRPGTYALLVGPTLLPLAWLISSAMHQSENTWASACLVAHAHLNGCIEALALTAMTLGGVAWITASRWRAERVSLGDTDLPVEAPARRRVEALRSRDPRLRALRIRVMRSSAEPVMTVGNLRPVVVLDPCFVAEVDDAVLHAALLHEAAHVQGMDPLRDFVARVALGMNPLQGLLAPEFERWRQAREAQCDSVAVFAGGQPLALAHGIVRAARFRCGGPALCGARRLHGDSDVTLKLRVALLLDGPARPRRSAGHVLLAALLLAAVCLPHGGETGALDYFHTAVEQLLHSH